MSGVINVINCNCNWLGTIWGIAWKKFKSRFIFEIRIRIQEAFRFRPCIAVVQQEVGNMIYPDVINVINCN